VVLVRSTKMPSKRASSAIRASDGEADLGRLQEAPVAAVADQRLVAGLERLAQAGHDRRALGGVLVGLGPVVSPVAGSRRTTTLVLPPCSRSGSKTAAHRRGG
jgi:hypothetical protein